MNKKIVFFDIDGTLIDEKTFQIPQSTIEAIHRAQANGHILIINTGRSNVSIDRILKDIGFDGYICGCGTYIEYRGNVIFHNVLDEELRRNVLNHVFKCNMQAIVEGTDGVYFRTDGNHPFFLESYNYYQKQGFPIYLFGPDELVPFDKFVVLYNNINDDIESFKAFAKDYFSLIQRAETFIELIPKPFSKATGIQFLIDYLGMSIDQTISIGDSTNDFPMLSYTKESVAMGNSNPILFDQVTHITTDINDNGIYNALKHFKLI